MSTHKRGQRVANLYGPWTLREDAVIRKCYPDYKAMRRRLSGRTYYAMRSRARFLGVALLRRGWTCADRRKLQRLYRSRH